MTSRARPDSHTHRAHTNTSTRMHTHTSTRPRPPLYTQYRGDPARAAPTLRPTFVLRTGARQRKREGGRRRTLSATVPLCRPACFLFPGGKAKCSWPCRGRRSRGGGHATPGPQHVFPTCFCVFLAGTNAGLDRPFSRRFQARRRKKLCSEMAVVARGASLWRRVSRDDYILAF